MERYGITIRKICDGITTLLELKNYIIFNDSYISEHDKILYNQNNEIFTILDFQEITENILIIPKGILYFDGYATRKFSCVKLDRMPNLNNIFYLYPNN